MGVGHGPSKRVALPGLLQTALPPHDAAALSALRRRRRRIGPAQPTCTKPISTASAAR